jgi:cell division protein FtsQ
MAVAKKNRSKKSDPEERLVTRKKVFVAFLSLFLLVSAGITVKIMLRRVVFFPIREIEITGNKHLNDKEVSNISELKMGVSMLSVSSRTIAKKLERSPWIKEVELRKELPDRIVIRVREAVPSALFKKNNEYYLVDSDGDFLEKQATDEKFLPVIRGDARNGEAFREAVKVAGVLREYGVVGAEDAEILIGNREDLTVRNGTTTIKVGYGNYEDKMKRYLELKDEIARRGIPVDYIDLRYARRVVVRTAGRGKN